MYFAGLPVQDQTSLLSVVVAGVRVTTDPEVGAVPHTVMTPRGLMLALATRPVAEMVMALIQSALQEP